MPEDLTPPPRREDLDLAECARNVRDLLCSFLTRMFNPRDVIMQRDNSEAAEASVTILEHVTKLTVHVTVRIEETPDG